MTRTHHINPPTQITKDFTPEGCSAPVGDVMTYGAGAQFQELNQFAYQNKYSIYDPHPFTSDP